MYVCLCVCVWDWRSAVRESCDFWIEIRRAILTSEKHKIRYVSFFFFFLTTIMPKCYLQVYINMCIFLNWESILLGCFLFVCFWITGSVGKKLTVGDGAVWTFPQLITRANRETADNLRKWRRARSPPASFPVPPFFLPCAPAVPVLRSPHAVMSRLYSHRSDLTVFREGCRCPGSIRVASDNSNSTHV